MTAKDKLVQWAKEKKVYCYGAGNYGKIVAYALMDLKVDFKGFLVTDGENNSATVLHKPVVELKAFDNSEDKLILVCASLLFRQEMVEELKKNCIENYRLISEDMVNELDKSTDFDIEVDTNKYVNVLLYHRVCNRKDDCWKLAVSPEEFELQMKYIKENYGVLRFEDDWSGIRKKSIVITFDDGYVDNLVYAVPILEKYGMPATIFISTDNIGSKNKFWWDELADLFIYSKEPFVIFQKQKYYLEKQEDREKCCQEIRRFLMKMNSEERMLEIEKLYKLFRVDKKTSDADRTLNDKEIKQLSKMKNITIGAHTKSHSQLAAMPSRVQCRQIEESKAVLEKITGNRIEVFSYPFGNKEDYTMETVNIVRRCRFVKAAAVKGGLYDEKVSQFEIPRNNVPGGTNLEAFKKLLKKIWFEY